ncbi:MAG TPA: thrombospondin type 3 repeat-containing protein, partial [bacterium]|nr:thrombospondin type 3 repeat-containing protein [bacterium]
ALYDTDSDGIPDLFDNCSFSGIYSTDGTVSNNPDQTIDGDSNIHDVDLCPYHRDKTSMNMDHDSYGDMCDPDIDGDGISNIAEGMSAAYLYQIIPANDLTQSDYAALNPFIDGSADKIRGKYFITSCFAGLATHCDETDPDYCAKGNKPGNKYITDLCFFDDTRIDSSLTVAKNGTFKFAAGGSYDEADHDENGLLDAHFPPPNYWYLRKYIKDKDYQDPDFLFHDFPDIFTSDFDYLPDGMKRTYEYTHSSGISKTGLGAKWNIPGQFGMSHITFQEYAVNSNYGEDWPENYYNCYIHCYMIADTNSGFDVGGFVEVGYYSGSSCRDLCDAEYGANDPYDPDDDTCNKVLDYDCDGIRDWEDNCPYTWNIDQLDHDEYDSVNDKWLGDGVGNACDNCRNLLNPREMNNMEIVSAPCNEERTVGGAACLATTKKSTTRDYKGNYYWQPDHDFDGAGDACDNDFIAWVSFRNAPQNQDSPPVKISVSGLSTIYETSHNVSIKVSLDLVATRYVPGEEYNSTNRFCGLSPEQYSVGLWGQAGYCSTERRNNSSCIIDFGYSHGSDLRPIAIHPDPGSGVLYIENWKPATYDKNSEKIAIENDPKTNNFTWSWRTDFANLFPIYEPQLTSPSLCNNYDESLNECFDTEINKFYYSLSSGLISEDSTQQYIVSDFNTMKGNENVNGLYFRNEKRYARTERLSKDPVSISFFKRQKIILNPFEGIVNCLGAPCNFPERWWHDFLIDELLNGPRPYETPGMDHYFKNEFGSDMTRSGTELREWSNLSNIPSMNSLLKPQFLTTITKAEDGLKTGIKMTSQNIMQFMSYTFQNSNISFELVEMDKGSIGDWRKRGTLINVPDYFLPVSSTFYNGKLYVISIEETSAANLKKIYEIRPVEILGNICGDSLNTFEPVFVEDVSFLSGITIYPFDDYIAVIGDGGNGMEVHKLAEQNGDFYMTDISGQTLPQGRDVYTVEVKNGELFLAGGAKIGNGNMDLKTDAWRFSESSGWTLIRNDLNIFPGNFRIDFEDNNLILTDRSVSPLGTTERISIKEDGSGDTPEIETVVVDGAVISFSNTYCLNETDSIVKGGLEISGECVPFTHPWYRSFATGSTIYSVAGKGDRLYVGTNNSIKVYDISDPNALVLKSTFSTGGRIVYDLEVADDDVMYAATSGGIYKLNTANPDTLASLSFFATSYNYQYRIQLYNDKLYVGDDNGINIRDKETFTRLAYINIDSVLDFAIANGEIALYRSSFWSAGLHIRDVETLNLKAYEYAECYTGELTTDHGAFYLSCDGYEYRFEGRPDTYFNYYPLDGDIREMQENHVYNGWT